MLALLVIARSTPQKHTHGTSQVLAIRLLLSRAIQLKLARPCLHHVFENHQISAHSSASQHAAAFVSVDT